MTNGKTLAPGSPADHKSLVPGVTIESFRKPGGSIAPLRIDIHRAA
jgi:hypothetical protein